MLSEKYKIVLVGLSTEQINSLPDNIIGLPPTNTPKELAKIYSAADWFINPSMEETMGLVSVEALACGTPAIVSNLTAVPEMIDPDCGIVVKKNDADGFYEAIATLGRSFLQEDCLKHARKFDMNEKYNEYIDIYNKISGVINL